jgi:acyl carrier protein
MTSRLAEPSPAASPHAGGDDADGVLAMVRDAIVLVLEVDPETVTRETRLVDDLGADSLALVEIVEIVEEQLIAAGHPRFHIDDEDLESLTTVGAAVSYALARL